VKRKDADALFAKWIPSVLAGLGPVVVFGGLYSVLTRVAHLPIATSLLIAVVAAIPPLIYFGGRYYKPSYIGADKRCAAKDSRARSACRYFIAGASFGNGCGRLREDGRCRYAVR
jgi:hypothetical protein